MDQGTTFPKFTVGLDVGDRQSHFCVLDAWGEVIAEGRCRTQREALLEAVAPWPGCRVVMEAGGHSPWMSRELEAAGYEVLVANSYEAGKLYRGRDKSDRRDAELLARLGRSDPRLLKPLRHRGAQAMADRALLRSRDALVRSRTLLINHARGIVKTVGERLPSCDATAFARHARDQVPTSLRPALDPIVDVIEELTKRIRAFDREIERVRRERYPETKLFEPIRGVGSLTSLAFVLSIDDPSRFAKSRDVGSYVGLRPRRHQSGDDDPELGITRAGDPQLRRLLVQCAHYILGPFGEDCELQRFGNRLKARGGRAAHKRAIVAVARKLAVLMHRLWVTGEVYEPLRADEAR